MSVREVSTRVLVDGVEWGHESATWTGRSSGALPTHLGGGGSRWDSTAEIVWWHKGVHKDLPFPEVSERVPADGAKVQIFAQSTGPERLVFTGVVTASSADGPTVTSRCIDTRDRLRKTIRTEALSAFMPLHEDGWGFNTRSGCTPLWPVYQIARAGGLNATYVPSGVATYIDVPLVGAVWAMPGGGRVVQSARWSDDSNPNYGPRFTPAEWGLGVGDGTVQVWPSGAAQTSRRYRVAMTVASTSSGVIDVQIIHVGSASFWAVHVTAARVVEMRTVTGGTYTVVASLALSGALAFAVTVRGTSVTIETDDGRSATGTGTIPSGVIDRVYLRAETGSSVGGLTIVDPGASGGSFVTFYDGPSLVVQYGLGAQVVDVVPSIRDEDALTTLQELAQQCLGAVRMDGRGRLLYRTMESLWTQPTTHTVSTSREVLAAAWETDAQAAASRIAVRHRMWSVSSSKYAGIDVASLSGSMSPGEVREEWLTVPDDEEWWYPDYATSLAGSATPSSVGSWRGATEEDGSGDPVKSGAFTLYLDPVTPWSTKVRVTALTKAINLQMASDATIPWNLRGGDGLRFRARGFARAREDIAYAGSGPSWAQEYEHDGSRWLDETTAAACASWLAGLGMYGKPRLTRLELLFDETVEPWSVVTADLALHGVAVDLLVEEVDQRPADGVTLVSGVVKGVTVTGSGTYSELAAAWASGSYSGLTTAWGLIGGDYDELAETPLKGAPIS